MKSLFLILPLLLAGVACDKQTDAADRNATTTAADTSLQASVRDAISRATVNNDGIFIKVDDGKVTLSGTVATTADRDAVVKAAKAVPSVKSVEDDLTVKN